MDEIEGSGKPNWVERRKASEDNLSRDSEALWRDIRVALEEAAKSLKRRYSQEADVEFVNGHRIKVTVKKNTSASKVTQIDIIWKDDNRIHASFLGGSRTPASFSIRADHVAGFITDRDGNTVDADEVSRQILEPIFFGDFIKFERGFIG